MVNYSGPETALGALLDYADSRGLGQRQLSGPNGINLGTLHRYRTGQRPSDSTLARIFKLCDYFDISPKYSPSGVGSDSTARETEEDSILRIARKEAGLTIKQAARKFGVSTVTWRAYELGESHPGEAMQQEIHTYIKRRLKVKLSEDPQGLFPPKLKLPPVESISLSAFQPADLELLSYAKPSMERYQFRREMRQAVSDALSSGFLKPREEKVMRIRYGIDDGKERTNDETAEFLNLTEKRAKPCTRERMRQIEAKALKKLRGPWNHHKDELKSFWEA